MQGQEQRESEPGLPRRSPRPSFDGAFISPTPDLSGDSERGGPLLGDDALRPRVWTTLAIGVAAIPIATTVAAAVLAVAAVLDSGPGVLHSTQTLQQWINSYAETRNGLFVLVIPGQFAFLSMAVGAALFSRQPVLYRLGLQRGSLPLWVWIVFIFATPLIGVLTSLLLSCFINDMSEQLKLMEEMIRAHTQTFFWGLVALVAVVPGVIEEVMFRGYVQSRLIERWHPVAAIGASALLFSVAHLDLVHAIGVLPLGLWLGAVAWRAGSVWPAIICHIVNNVVSVLGSKYHETTSFGIHWDAMTVITLAISIPAFLFSLLLFRER